MKARTLYILLATVALASALARADDVTANKITYSNAKIFGIEDGQLVFDYNGQTLRKPLDTITKVHVTGQDPLNEAEDSAALHKIAEAVKAYDQAFDRADVDWLKQLVIIRRLGALRQAPDMIDRAVTEWLSVLDQSKEAKFAVNLRPAKVAAKGSKANDDAIAALELKEKDLAKDSPALNEVRGLLAELYRAQGSADKAKAMALKMGSAPTTVRHTPDGSENSHTPAKPGANLEEILKTAKEQIDSGVAKEALSSLNGSLQQFTVDGLPKALMLMGKAQMAMAKSAKGDPARDLREAAVLNFMRVVTFYPTLTDVPAEAGYLAGKVNLDLGNREAARAAFNKVVSTYSDSPFAAQASKAVEAMEGGKAKK